MTTTNRHSSTPLPNFSSLGSSALLFCAPEPLDISWQRRIWALSDIAKSWHGVSEVIPGMNNLLLIFDPLLTTTNTLQAKVCDAWSTCYRAGKAGKTLEIGVIYGGEYGVDLEHVAQHANLSIEETVRLHSQAVYTVYCLGAYPGFGYLVGLDSRLFTPRRQEPRLQVPARSVAIGGAQTGVIPSAQPSGWQIIGSTETVFFDIKNSPPALLAPGDTITFRIEAIQL